MNGTRSTAGPKSGRALTLSPALAAFKLEDAELESQLKSLEVDASSATASVTLPQMRGALLTLN